MIHTMHRSAENGFKRQLCDTAGDKATKLIPLAQTAFLLLLTTARLHTLTSQLLGRAVQWGLLGDSFSPFHKRLLLTAAEKPWIR